MTGYSAVHQCSQFTWGRLAVVSVAVYLCAMGRVLDAQSIDINDPLFTNPNRTIWIDIHRDYFYSHPEAIGQLLIYDKYVNSYDTRLDSLPEFERMAAGVEYATSLNNDLAGYDRRIAELAGRAEVTIPLERYLDIGLEALGQSPGGQQYASVGKFVKEVNKDLYLTFAQPYLDSLFRAEAAQALVPGYVDLALGRIYDASMNHPIVADAITQSLALKTLAPPGVNWSELLDRQQRQIGDQLRTEQDPDVRALLQIKHDVYGFFSKNPPDAEPNSEATARDLQNLASGLINAQKAAIEKALRAQQEALLTSARKRANKEADRRIAERRNDAIESLGTGFGSLIRHVDSKLATWVETLAVNSARLMRASDKYFVALEDGDHTWGALQLSGNFLNVAASLVNLALGLPSNEAIIIEQLGLLRRQVADLQRQMHGRFDFIERQLQQIARQLAICFRVLNETTRDTNIRVQSLQHDMAELMRQTRIVREEYRIMEREFQRYEWSQPLYRMLVGSSFWSRERSEDDYELAVESLIRAGTEAAGQMTIWIGEDVNSPDNSYQQLVATMNPFVGYEYLVRPLVQTAAATKRSIPPRVLNRSLWLWSTKNYLLLTARHPTFSTLETSEAVSRLIESGESWQALSKWFCSTPNGKPDIDLFESLADNYFQALTALLDGVEEAKTTYLRTNCNLFSPYRSAYQLLPSSDHYIPLKQKLLQEMITPYEDYRIVGSRSDVPALELKIPDDIEKVIPGPYIIAHNLGCGRIRLYYDDVRGVVTEFKITRESRWWVTGNFKLCVTLRATYTELLDGGSREGNTHLIFRRSIVSVGEKRMALVGYNPGSIDASMINDNQLHERLRLENWRNLFDWTQLPMDGVVPYPKDEGIFQYVLKNDWDGRKDASPEFFRLNPLFDSSSMADRFASDSEEVSESLFHQPEKDVNKRVLADYEVNPIAVEIASLMPRSANFDAVVATVTERLEKLRLSLEQHLSHEIDSGELKPLGEALDFHRGMLIGYCRLAFPESSAHSPDIVSLFFGPSRIPTAADVRTAVLAVNRMKELESVLRAQLFPIGTWRPAVGANTSAEPQNAREKVLRIFARLDAVKAQNERSGYTIGPEDMNLFFPIFRSEIGLPLDRTRRLQQQGVPKDCELLEKCLQDMFRREAARWRSRNDEVDGETLSEIEKELASVVNDTKEITLDTLMFHRDEPVQSLSHLYRVRAQLIKPVVRELLNREHYWEEDRDVATMLWWLKLYQRGKETVPSDN